MSFGVHYDDSTPGHAPEWRGRPTVAVGQRAAVTYPGKIGAAWYGVVLSHAHRADGTYLGVAEILCIGVDAVANQALTRLVGQQFAVPADDLFGL